MKMVSLNTNIPADVKSKLKALAKQRRMTMNRVIEELVKSEFQKSNKKD